MFTTVRIIKDIDAKDISKGKKIQEYIIEGNTVMPWYINCLSIRFFKGIIEFKLLDDFIVKKTYSNEDGEHLWIMGKDKIPVTEQIELMRKEGLENIEPKYEKIM